MNKKMKGKKIALSIIGIFIISILGYIFYIDRNQENSFGPVLSLSSPAAQDGGTNRYQLLVAMTGSSTVYGPRPFYYLDNNSSTGVIVGTYSPDSYGKNGGIIMLHPLGNGKFTLYWEISSTMLWAPATPRVDLLSLTGSSSKDLVTYWGNYGAGNAQVVVQYWIFALDVKDRTYKVLNPIVDRNKNPITNYNFATLDPTHYFNRFQTAPSDPEYAFNIFQDLDNDGIPEVIINSPFLEQMAIIEPDLLNHGSNYNQIYKWDGSEYYLWKETDDTSINQAQLK